MVQSQDSRLDKLKKTLQKDGLVLLVHLSALFLFVRLVWLVVSGSFFIDPIRQSTTLTGKLAITFLLLSLTCTPIYIITGWSMLLRARKPLGLYAFGYALLHGLTYVGWDYRFDFSLLLDNLKYERYIIVGGSAFLVLALLAITSHRTLKKRMGKIWKLFQRLVYLAGGLAVVHVMWLRKSPREVYPLALILTILLAIRVPWLKGVIIRLRQSLAKGTKLT